MGALKSGAARLRVRSLCIRQKEKKKKGEKNPKAPQVTLPAPSSPPCASSGHLKVCRVAPGAEGSGVLRGGRPADLTAPCIPPCTPPPRLI